MPVTVMGAGHRREKMLETMRTAKYKLMRRVKKLAVWNEEKGAFKIFR
jgi:hypothetical protein